MILTMVMLLALLKLLEVYSLTYLALQLRVFPIQLFLNLKFIITITSLRLYLNQKTQKNMHLIKLARKSLTVKKFKWVSWFSTFLMVQWFQKDTICCLNMTVWISSIRSMTAILVIGKVSSRVQNILLKKSLCYLMM